MGIDPISKPAAPSVPLAGSTQGPQGAHPERAFEVAPSAPTQSTAAVNAVSSDLASLRAGAVDLNGYLDAKVREATAHLGALGASELEAVRSALRDRLATDPTLVELVQRATGETPSPQE